MIGGYLVSLWRSFKIQWRVMGALLIREMSTRYGRDNIGFLWVIGEPILFCAGVAIVWTAIRPSHEHGLPMTAFVVTGYVPLTMWRHCIGRSVKAFESNGSLLFHRQVTPLDIITVRVGLEIIGAIMAGLIVTTVAVAIGAMDPPEDLGLVYVGTIYQGLFGYACGLIIASLSEASEIIEKALGVLMYLALPFTGAFLMVDWLPQKYQFVMLASPSVQNIEMIRAGQFGRMAHAHYDLVYNTWITALLILIGLSLTLRVRRYIVVQ
jgi:capsular polysaccharide transport system permease protein